MLGPVFRAHDEDRDRLVAVKVFKLDLTPELADEVGDDLQGLVRHWPTAMPGLVRPVRAGVDHATPWLAQEFAAGEGLDAVLRRRTRPSIDDVVALVARIADALDAGAADGLTHGALHPRDILVGPDLDDIAITGVGIAHVVERAGFRAPRRRPYVAPERVAGHGWDARADLYSLAVITLELIGTRRASSGGHLPVATVLDEAGLDIESWSRALTRALADDPSQRFDTARGFADALDAACSSESRAPRLPLEDADEPAVEPDAGADDPSGGSMGELDRPSWAPAADVLRAPVEGLPVEVRERADHPLLADEFPLAGDVRLDDGLEGRHGQDRARAVTIGDDAEPDVAWQAPAPAAHVPGEPVAARPYGLLAATLCLGIFIGFLAGAWVMRGGAFSASAPDAGRVEAPVARAEVRDEPVVANDVVPSATSGVAGAAASSPRAPAPEARSETPVATPAAQVDQRPGILRITSTPSGARVAVDGRARGATPLVLRDLRLGTYRLALSRDGFEPRSTRVTLSAGRPDAAVEVTLPRETPRRMAAPPAVASAATTGQGTVAVATRPSGARVFIDGVAVGVAPVTVPNVAAGTRQIRLELTGHRPWTTAVEVTPNQTRRVSASLEPTGAR